MLSTMMPSGERPRVGWRARLDRARWRLLHTVRPGRAEPDLDRELTAHLALLEDELQRQGLDPVEARRRARLVLGGVDQTKERHRDARAFRALDDLRRDAMYAIRTLRRHPLAAATAALSLAIGIGLNAAIFSVLDWVLLRPLPYPAAHQLVRISTAGTAPVSGPGLVTFEEFPAFSRAPSIAAAMAYSTATRALGGGQVQPEHVVVARIAGDAIGTLGVPPSLGRGFSAAEVSGSVPVAL